MLAFCSLCRAPKNAGPRAVTICDSCLRERDPAPHSKTLLAARPSSDDGERFSPSTAASPKNAPCRAPSGLVREIVTAALVLASMPVLWLIGSSFLSN